MVRLSYEEAYGVGDEDNDDFNLAELFHSDELDLGSPEHLGPECLTICECAAELNTHMKDAHPEPAGRT